jgi:hypothetical protein
LLAVVTVKNCVEYRRTNYESNSRCTLRFGHGTMIYGPLASSGLLESCPRNGNLPKSPFTHRRCYAIGWHKSSRKVEACVASADGTRTSTTRAALVAGVVKRSKENLTVHFKVKDLNTWRTSYNGHEKDRVSAGITNGRVFRSPDDPNDVVILQDVADVSKARTWLTSNEMKSVMEKSGVLGSPSIRFAAAA